jgi:hypothetical protein
MIRRAFVAAVVLIAAASLVGCTGTPSDMPTVAQETETSAPSASAELVALDGEWVATRTVTVGNDSSEVYTVGFSEQRLLGFETSTCDESCAGTVLSGVSLDGRSSAQFEQSDSVITFQFTGYNDCFDIETGALLLANGYEYLLVYQLGVDASEDSAATSLSGTALNLYTPTPDAIAAGCETDTGRIVYDVTVARA